ncbi:MAG: ATP-dependent Clp protease adaptor ClpS [Paludibacteraceae bacterium]|nr:ATP-dependent Clp protease adaptor ClpS [Paludibacteraceae bacterium]
MAKQNTSVKERTRTNLQEPHDYVVIFHNDDFTTYDFVVKVLKVVFRKSESEAVKLTVQVDTEGQAIVGHYSYDIAVTKTNKAIQMARAENFPLKITYEQA